MSKNLTDHPFTFLATKKREGARAREERRRMAEVVLITGTATGIGTLLDYFLTFLAVDESSLASQFNIQKVAAFL